MQYAHSLRRAVPLVAKTISHSTKRTWCHGAPMLMTCQHASRFSVGTPTGDAVAKDVDAEIATLGEMEASITQRSTIAEERGSGETGAESLVKSAQNAARKQYAAEEKAYAHKAISSTGKQYAERVKRLINIDATSNQGVRVNSLSANPYGWDIDTREVKEAPLWMLYEAARQEERMIDKNVGKKPPRIDNETEIRVPMRDDKGRAYATGRRKTAVARVWVGEGDGSFIVNGRPLVEYFPRLHDRKLAMEPLIVTEACGAFDVYMTVAGGGLTGQAGAARHGLANALARFDPQLKPVLRRFEMIQRDPRMVERKKPGQKKARKRFQWIKR